MRRNALGLARTVIESGFDLDLPKLIDVGLASLPDAVKPHADRNTETVRADLYDFILDRLKGYYADKGVAATHFNAVAELKPASLYDFDRRIDAIGIFATLPEAEALAAANKRIRNILRKVEGEIPGDIDTTLLREPAEEALAEAVEAAIGDTGDALHRHDYVAVLARLARLRPQVDAFFDGVMVNADDPQLRANRLALLKKRRPPGQRGRHRASVQLMRTARDGAATIACRTGLANADWFIGSRCHEAAVPFPLQMPHACTPQQRLRPTQQARNTPKPGICRTG